MNEAIAQLLTTLETTTPSLLSQILMPIGPNMEQNDWSGLLYGIEELAQNGNYELAEQMMAVCLQVAEEHKAGKPIRDVTYFLGHVYFHQGKMVQANEAYQAVVDGGKKAADEDSLFQASLALSSISRIYLEQGQIPDAIATIEESLDLDSQLGQKKAAILSRLQLASLYLVQEDFARAEATLQHALQGAQKLDKPFLSALVLMRLGDIQLDLENPVQALPYFETAMDELDAVGDSEDWDLHVKAYRDLYILLGTARQELGETDLAIRAFSSSARLSYFLEDTRGQVVSITWLGSVQTEAGRPELALRSFDAAERLAHTIHYDGWIGTIQFFRASALQAQNRLDEAENAVNEAIQNHRATLGNNSPDEVGCLMKLGRIALEKGDSNKAIAWYQRALRILREIGVSQMHRLIYLRLGEAYWVQSEYSQAYEMLCQALDVYEIKRQTVSKSWARVDFGPSRDQVYEYLSRTCLALGHVEEAFVVAEEGRMRVFREQLETQPVMVDSNDALDWQEIKSLLSLESQ